MHTKIFSVYLSILLSLRVHIQRRGFHGRGQISRELSPMLDTKHLHFLRHCSFSAAAVLPKVHEHSACTVLLTEAEALLTLTGTERAQLLCIKISGSFSNSVTDHFEGPQLMFFLAQPPSPGNKKDLQGSELLLGTKECLSLQLPTGLVGPTALHPGSSNAHRFLLTIHLH